MSNIVFSQNKVLSDFFDCSVRILDYHFYVEGDGFGMSKFEFKIVCDRQLSDKYYQKARFSGCYLSAPTEVNQAVHYSYYFSNNSLTREYEYAGLFVKGSKLRKKLLKQMIKYNGDVT